jgi:hypothetical protein
MKPDVYIRGEDVIWYKSTGAGFSTRQVVCKFVRHISALSARIIEDYGTDKAAEHIVELGSIQPVKNNDSEIESYRQAMGLLSVGFNAFKPHDKTTWPPLSDQDRSDLVATELGLMYLSLPDMTWQTGNGAWYQADAVAFWIDLNDLAVALAEAEYLGMPFQKR